MIVNARVTFQRSPIHVLEKFTFKDTGRALAEFKNRSGFEECVIVQTCNRVEVYGAGSKIDRDKISKTWSELAGIKEDAVCKNVEFSGGSEVTSHLLHLTSGLESMVLGEYAACYRFCIKSVHGHLYYGNLLANYVFNLA